MSDEGFHEIQLNGKQLVFLFMAATVVSVVIFLLGVMVGRGVPTARAQAAELATDASADPTAAIESSGATASTSSDRAPVSAQESLTYAERLAAPTPAQDTLKDTEVVLEPPPPVREPAVAAASTPPPAKPAPAPVTPPAAAPAAAPAPIPAATASFAEPAGNGHVVQVGAYPRGQAETIARRLASRGYPAFITPRSQGLFAVRVGKYSDKREAEAVAGRLEQQEQFNKPWVTR
jgi:cell division septation protein DedD